MIKLLLNKYPLLIIPELAELIGLNEAIILQQIHYWVEINREADKNFKDSFYWTYNSYEGWRKQFPFWSVDTIKRAVASLKRQRLVICGNYNQLKIDRTQWYRIDYVMLDRITHPYRPRIESRFSARMPNIVSGNGGGKMPQPLVQNATMGK